MPPGMAAVIFMLGMLQQQLEVPRQGMLNAKTAWLVMVTTKRMTIRMDRCLRFFTVSRIPLIRIIIDNFIEMSSACQAPKQQIGVTH